MGSAAGGGVPQWNCGAELCRRARAGDPLCPARTQTGLALSANGRDWILIGASPDLPEQIRNTSALHPAPGETRASPIAAVVLTGADVDAIGGLLSLRERQAFDLLATGRVHASLDANLIFEVLGREVVRRRPVALDEPVELVGGATIELFAVPGKPPLWREAEEGIAHREDEATVGVMVRHGRARLAHIPGCAALTPSLAERLAGVDLLFFDGTLWSDEEMRLSGAGEKTGARMGHMSLSGPGGTLAAFDAVPARRKLLIHLNHTNPVVADDSPERARVKALGWDVAHDGLRISLPR